MRRLVSLPHNLQTISASCINYIFPVLLSSALPLSGDYKQLNQSWTLNVSTQWPMWCPVNCFQNIYLASIIHLVLILSRENRIEWLSDPSKMSDPDCGRCVIFKIKKLKNMSKTFNVDVELQSYAMWGLVLCSM